MKFRTKLDEVQYKLQGLDEEVIRKKLKLLRVAKDREKQRNMKAQWRRNKHKLLKGLKKWHNSTQGKRFHRALGRFNALRDSFNESSLNNKVKLSLDEINNALLGLSSIETHLFLELNYYEPDIEALEEFIEIVHNFIEDAKDLKEKLLEAIYTGEIETKDLNTLAEIFDFFVDPKMYLYSKRESLGLSNDKNQAPDLMEQLAFLENIDLSKSTKEQIDEFFKKDKNG